ncbi:hypothetical protein KBX06_04185 [Micromonospora sp. C31]|uniref:hypothetical protein n=1 Tax=Micromonospora sp. C31 TaxID=2824876 RepID=UPI001B359AEB|nr:hypothetical protein [Micromonospora sp. C31]MBQ1072368.1 hypothetical protein [Micromonospora sp. C31]
MPPPPHRPGALAWQVFRGSDAIRQGLVTEHQLRSSAWLRLRHDVYADARLHRDHALACRAAVLRLPPEALFAGPSAACLHGVEHAASFADDVHVLVPRGVRLGPQRGLRVHCTGAHRQPAGAGGGPYPTLRTPGDGLRTALRAPADGPGSPVRPVPGGPRVADLRTAGVPASTDPTSAAWETAVWLEPLRAVGIVDRLLRQGLTSRAALADVAARNADRPGGRRARWVFELADPGARSAAESELRVRLVLAGLPRPAVRHAVRAASGLVVHADLAWPAYRVAVAQDGRHAETDAGHLDRIARLVGAGWLVLPVTGRRLRQDFPGVLRETRAALGARGWRP